MQASAAPQPEATNDGEALEQRRADARDMTTGRELEALEQFMTDADVQVDASTNQPQWDGVPMNLADTLAWMLMAHGSWLSRSLSRTGEAGGELRSRDANRYTPPQ